MSEILEPQQEKACQLYVQLGHKTNAYKEAGYGSGSSPKTLNENASRFFSDSKIIARVTELQLIAQERHNVTLDSLTEELNEAKGLAYQEKQISAGISAIMGKAKIHGFDKTILGGEVQTVVKIIDLSGKGE